VLLLLLLLVVVIKASKSEYDNFFYLFPQFRDSRCRADREK
jgi:hypothetical protein